MTGILIRIAAEVAEEDAAEDNEQTTPYWRVIAKDGSLQHNLPGGVEHEKELLAQEGHTVARQGKRLIVVNFERNLLEL